MKSTQKKNNLLVVRLGVMRVSTDVLLTLSNKNIEKYSDELQQPTVNLIDFYKLIV